MDFKEKITALPDACGVYIMRSKGKDMLYVGKALSIKKRILSHFKDINVESKVLWLNKVEDIEYILCDTEEQALLLEYSLIKEKKPKYNVAMRDDKSFPYVVFTKEAYPRVYVARLKERITGQVRGPFVNVRLLKSVLKLIRKIFPFRSCRVMPKNPCLYYHLHMCPAPCIHNVDTALYGETVNNIYAVISGERKKLLKKLDLRMKKVARQMKFEEAARLRDTIVAINNLYSGGEKFSEFIVLKEVLKLQKIPLSIEAIDISNISGKQAAGSVVVFKNGVPDKNSYRRYRIKGARGIDDYKMTAEVVRRRYTRLKEERRPLPDLILIDGGYGHVRAAYRKLETLALNIPVIGIAKKNEEIWFPQKKKPLLLSKDNPALHLIQRVRNEAHRFAHKYHVLLRKKKILESSPSTSFRTNN